MARGRRFPRRYAITTTETTNLGSSGGQVKLGYFKSIDPDNVTAYLHNVNVSALINEGDGDNGGLIFYLSTASTWADGNVICAKAINGFAGNCSLRARRRIDDDSTLPGATFGVVYLWAECTDISFVGDVDVRIVHEAWGNAHTFTDS